jgi:hypothetical protein
MPLPDAAFAARPADETLEAVLAKARAAAGIEEFAKGGKDLVLEGEATVLRVPGRWSIRVAPDGRFASSIDARLSGGSGYDGATVWRVDPTGLASAQLFEQREKLLLQHGLAFGTWCVEGGPLVPVALVADSGPATNTVRVRARGGVVVVEVDLDAATALPREARWNAGLGRETWRWSQWRREGGLAVAREHTVDDEGMINVVRITSAAQVEPAGAAAFAMPAQRPGDMTFDGSAPARLAGRLTRTRHLLVRAKIDGHELEGLIFDSGAGGNVLAPGVAAELGLDPFGEYWQSGAGARRSVAHAYEARELTVGPVTIRHPRFGTIDTSALETAFGQKISGVLGYPLLQRTVACVDMRAGTVDLFDPATFEREGVTWRPLLLHGNHPHVTCTFETDGEEEGVFRIDTGAPVVTVIFHWPAVKSLGLLEGRETAPFGGLAGVGGATRARSGRLSWFELGGITFDEPIVIFAQDENGAMADPWTAGTLGGGFLDRFELIFDYQHDRVGFVPRERES